MEMEQTVGRDVPISNPQAMQAKRTWGQVGHWAAITVIVVAVLLPFIPLAVWSFSRQE